MMNDVEYEFVRKEEGGFVSDKDDSGGATNRGVTQATYDTYRNAKKLPTRSVRFCTLAETRDIYSQFFDACSAASLPSGLALMHFDFAINAGNHRANRTLQQVLNITDDGVIGPKTLDAVSKVDVPATIAAYASARRDFYRGLAVKRPKDLKFLKGWLSRTDRVERAALAQYTQV